MLFDAIRTTNGRQRAGSALILVVVLTVLLSAVGILFVLMSRLDEMTSSALSTNEELDAGVAAVVSKIEQVLADDLEDVFKYYNRDFGGSSDNWDRPGDDSWLASLEPVRIESIDDTPDDPDDDDYRWPYITDLYGSIRNLGGSWIDPDQWNDDAARYRVGASGVLARVISPDERMWVIQEGADPDKTQWLPGNVRYYGARADADGDGIADSRWVPIPNLSGAKGQTFYTAIRIVGNNDKLNLNTAHSFTENVSRGAYLSEVDYESFLRGADNDPGNTTGMEDNIRAARMGSGYDPLVDTAARYHNEALMNIENTGLMYNLFDIGDELEIANRYMLSSQTQARFENVAHFTFDAGGGIYSALEVPIESNANFKIWKWRVDPRNFADEKYTNPLDGSPIDNLNIYRYDRRHVCTFYSFDKLWRREYPYVYYDAFDTANCAADNSSVHGEIKPGYSYEFDLGGPDENTFILDDMFMPWTGPVSIRNIQMIDSGLVTDAGIRYEQRKLVRKNVLHLLYALRAHFINETDISDLLTDPEDAINIAAIKAAQTVANMIDYIDGASDTMEGPFSEDDTALVLGYDFGDQKNENPTYIDRHIIRSLILEASNGVIDLDEDLSDGESRYPEYEFGLIPDDQTDLDIWGDTVYGYERQPFITEMNAYNDLVNNTHFGIELYNPYNAPIYLAGQPDDIQWRVSIGRTVEYDIGDYNIEFDETQLTAEQAEIEASTGGDTGRLLLLSAIDPIKLPFNAGTAKIVIPALAGSLSPSNIVKLQRRNPKWEDGDPEKYKFIVVDQTTVGQTLDLLFASNTTLPLVSKRDDEMWRFVTPEGSISTSVGNIPTLGSANNVTFSPTPISIQLPVANNDIPLMTLNDLEYILSIGNSIATGPGSGTVITRSITDQISYVSAEDEVRFDVESTPELLDYVFFMNRPNIGNLPGRININTASREVLRSAIVPDDQWDVDELVDNIVKYREDPTKGPFKSILDLYNVAGFDGKSYKNPAIPIGDAELIGDIEYRHWLLSRVANVFTVRSDVFTAYILVKLGEDGPQKRMIAIFDRSEVRSKSDRPRLISLHSVPDPR